MRGEEEEMGRKKRGEGKGIKKSRGTSEGGKLEGNEAKRGRREEEREHNNVKITNENLSFSLTFKASTLPY